MTLAVVVSQSYGDVPRLRLDVDSTPAGPEPVPDGSSLAIYRIHEDGSRYQVITEVGARFVSGSWAGFDYHPPFNQMCTYVAVAAGQESAPSNGEQLLSEFTWLIHPKDPTLSVQVDAITKVNGFSRRATAARHEVYGKPTRFVSGEARKGRTGTMEIVCDTWENEQAVFKLLTDDTTILVNVPAPRDLTWSWVHFGDDQYDNPGQKVTSPYRLANLPFEETDQPDVDLSPPWTDADVVAEFATETAMLAVFSTCEDLALDIR